MLLFENKGLIPEATITTMGVNAKIGDNPIGQFGTGLKYAIAIILRLGGTITIYRGQKKLEFSFKKESIRGKDFNIVCMNGRKLGFTDQLGLHWEPWMAYRELASNVKDEGGTVRIYDLGDEPPPPSRGVTQVVVECPSLEKAHRERGTLFLQTEPMYVLNGIEVHAGESEFVFYRGIRAHKLQKKSKYTYNFTRSMDLTEDRTLLHTHMIQYYLPRAIIQSTSASYLSHVLSNSAMSGFFEGHLPYSNIRDTHPSDAFMDVCEILKDKKDLVGFVVSVYNHHADLMPGRKSPYDVEISSTEAEMLERSLEALRAKGIELVQEQIVFKSKLELGRVQLSGRTRLILDHKILAGAQEKLTFALLEGAALIAGGGVFDQLCNRIMYGEWIDKEMIDTYDSRNADVEEIPY